MNGGAKEKWVIGDRINISLIREHTKTSDVMHVTDEQLLAYRDTAIEQAELYTGLVLSGSRRVTDRVILKKPRFGARFARYKLRRNTTDGVVYYQFPSGAKGMITIDENSRVVDIPAWQGMLGGNIASSCCDPCALNGQQENNLVSFTYSTGYSCADNVPAGIVLGILKFISWSTEHSGDMLITMANTTAARDSGIIGTNNGLWASGALELFRSYVVEGF